ncbi:MAG: hypothetical protein JOY91_16360 [Sinobacteraceae bacterium]|nr:hypothetical protein [Nevskiaceae bacterium]
MARLERKVDRYYGLAMAPAPEEVWAAEQRVAMRLRCEAKRYLNRIAHSRNAPPGVTGCTYTAEEKAHMRVDSAKLEALDAATITAWQAAYGVDPEYEAAGARAMCERDLQTIGARLRRARRLPPEAGDAEVEPTSAMPPVEDMLEVFERTQGRAAADANTNGPTNGTASPPYTPYSTDTDEGWHIT